jgi:hypothetical protein
MLNSLDYAIFGSFRSILWGDFLHKHFTKQVIAKPQSKVGHAMIWSPGSSVHMSEPSKDGSIGSKAWDDSLSFIAVDQFEQSIPLTQLQNDLSNVTLVNDGYSNGNRTKEWKIGNQSASQEKTSNDTNKGDEEGIISLNRMMLVEPFTVTTDGLPSSFISPSSLSKKIKVCEVVARESD